MTAADWLHIFGADKPVQIDGKGKRPISGYDQVPRLPDCDGDEWCRCVDCVDGRLSDRGML